MTRQNASGADVLLCQAIIEYHLREMETIYPGEENLTFSDEHEKRMRRMFTRERAKNRLRAVRRHAIRAAACAGIAFTFFGVLLLGNAGVRAAVRTAAIEWYDKFTNVRLSSEPESSAPTYDVSDVRLGYLPEGFIERDSSFMNGNMMKEYERTDGALLYFDTYTEGSASMGVDAEHSDYRIETRDGVAYSVFESNAEWYPSYVLWSAGGYDFILTAELPVDELLKIAENAEIVRP
jgi:hypothetical protein